MSVVYVEKAIADHPRTQEILRRMPNKTPVLCDHFGEIFNVKAQNFRVQKQNPAIILAKKNGVRVLPTPEGFGIGGEKNYYFSHMQNCVYDCRYCFLQGLYPSANYLIFVNYEDFMSDVRAICEAESDRNIYFFSGYDCDSLAFEANTQFVATFLPFFAQLPNAILELRTKSTQIRSLLQHDVIPNCVVAFSFTPQEISEAVEHGVPAVAKRIAAISQLAQAGWQVGLRFDPLIYSKHFETLYRELFAEIFAQLPTSSIHSVSVGPLRFPEKMHARIVELYPDDPLMAQPLVRRDRQYSYPPQVETQMKEFIFSLLENYVPKACVFACHVL